MLHPFTHAREIKAKAESKMDIILMDFLKFLCIGFKQQTVCTQLFSQCCQEICVILPFYTQLFITICYPPCGNQGCGMGSSGGSAPSFYII